jgi:hypothetical protein
MSKRFKPSQTHSCLMITLQQKRSMSDWFFIGSFSGLGAVMVICILTQAISTMYIEVLSKVEIIALITSLLVDLALFIRYDSHSFEKRNQIKTIEQKIRNKGKNSVQASFFGDSF